MKDVPARFLAAAVSVSAAGLVVLLLAMLAIADYWRVGSAPAACASAMPEPAVAVVLSGGPDFRRTRRAVALYDAGSVQALAFSGAGSGGDSAVRLAAEARRLGVPEEHVIVEDKARSTYQNFGYACALDALEPFTRIAIVTDQFHSYRAWATARRQCPQRTLCSAPVELPVSTQRRLAETRALLAYQLLGRAVWW
jgi:uncharacterized SAM-binding protein YcdF (DUF218 family)